MPAGDGDGDLDLTQIRHRIEVFSTCAATGLAQLPLFCTNVHGLALLQVRGTHRRPPGARIGPKLCWPGVLDARARHRTTERPQEGSGRSGRKTAERGPGGLRPLPSLSRGRTNRLVLSVRFLSLQAQARGVKTSNPQSGRLAAKLEAQKTAPRTAEPTPPERLVVRAWPCSL